MKNNSEIPNRRSIRLKDFDYAAPNAYFITIVTKNRADFLGSVENGEVILSEEGKIVQNVWNRLPKHYSNVQLDAFIVMPDHIHGILILLEPACAKDEGKRYTVSEIVRGLKSLSSRLINKMNGTPGTPRWQRNYFEHIIRDEEDLHEKREYIIHNANKWGEDLYYQ